jgi:hypothetical protein
MAAQPTQSIWFPKNTTIVDGTIYYKNDSSPTEYVGPITLSQLETEYGISLTTFNQTYSNFDEIEFTDMDITTGLNSVEYTGSSTSFIKFSVQYPTNEIIEVIFRIYFSFPA